MRTAIGAALVFLPFGVILGAGIALLGPWPTFGVVAATLAIITCIAGGLHLLSSQ